MGLDVGLCDGTGTNRHAQISNGDYIMKTIDTSKRRVYTRSHSNG